MDDALPGSLVGTVTEEDESPYMAEQNDAQLMQTVQNSNEYPFRLP
jgi:hypothetical protein